MTNRLRRKKRIGVNEVGVMLRPQMLDKFQRDPEFKILFFILFRKCSEHNLLENMLENMLAI